MKFLQKMVKNITLFGILVIISGVVITDIIFTSSSKNVSYNATNSTEGIHITLLYNAGVMIETEDTRIYIDPFDLPSSYSNYPADAILITHDHGDHYDPTSIDLIKTDNTSFYFPAIMAAEAFLYEAYSIEPEDTFIINDFNVRCFYMYTMPGSPDSSHPQSSNYVSYIIEIDGFTIFHAGDSWNIEEYQQLTGEIDLVLLPLGPGCQTMTEIDVVLAIETITPSYFIPIHYTEDVKATFIFLYNDRLEDSGCQLIDLTYYDSYILNQPTTVVDTTTDTTDNTSVDTTDATTIPTAADNGSNSPGFSLIVAISAGAFLTIIIKRKKNK
ncbi:MAG: MBL fold metallo-hydrolase [Promethearchaeota archaeon]